MRQHPSIYASYLLIFSGYILLFHTLAFNSSQTWPMTLTECKVILFTATPTYSLLFKSCQYIILVLRINESYKKSAMRYNKRLLIIWCIIIISWNLFHSFYAAIAATIIVVDGVCIYSISEFLFLSLGTLDIVACIVNTYLFLKPIIILKNKEVRRMAIKQFTLSMIAVLTTNIAMVLITLFALYQLFSALDVVITTFCIILMYRWNKSLVNKLCNICCCCCICGWYISKKNKTDENIQNIEMTVNETSGPSLGNSNTSSTIK